MSKKFRSNVDRNVCMWGSMIAVAIIVDSNQGRPGLTNTQSELLNIVQAISHFDRHFIPHQIFRKTDYDPSTPKDVMVDVAGEVEVVLWPGVEQEEMVRVEVGDEMSGVEQGWLRFVF